MDAQGNLNIHDRLEIARRYHELRSASAVQPESNGIAPTRAPTDRDVQETVDLLQIHTDLEEQLADIEDSMRVPQSVMEFVVDSRPAS